MADGAQWNLRATVVGVGFNHNYLRVPTIFHCLRLTVVVMACIDITPFINSNFFERLTVCLLIYCVSNASTDWDTNYGNWSLTLSTQGSMPVQTSGRLRHCFRFYGESTMITPTSQALLDEYRMEREVAG